MNAKKLSLLVVINPNASRAEEALPKLHRMVRREHERHPDDRPQEEGLEGAP